MPISREEKKMVSLRLSRIARDRLEELARHHGIDRTAVVEQLIRKEARRELAKAR